mmetsp:Transcript_3997/g.10098  ORF Transcript_3997/g.10098 Transcript_3997/m.10098 type:complete len:200 (-) Transcript_3997:1017-1616(-)
MEESLRRMRPQLKTERSRASRRPAASVAPGATLAKAAATATATTTMIPMRKSQSRSTRRKWAGSRRSVAPTKIMPAALISLAAARQATAMTRTSRHTTLGRQSPLRRRLLGTQATCRRPSPPRSCARPPPPFAALRKTCQRPSRRLAPWRASCAPPQRSCRPTRWSSHRRCYLCSCPSGWAMSRWAAQQGRARRRATVR